MPLRLLGGVAVRLRSAGLPPALQREYKDLDFVTTKKGSGGTQTLLKGLGYEPQVGFNAMNARERLLFFDDAHGRQVDVFVSSFRMCHEIPLERRLEAQSDTVPLAELVLTKLQIIELNEKDVRDAVALFVEHDVTDDDAGINGARIAELCGDDWGLWRTITRNLDSVRDHLGELRRRPRPRRAGLSLPSRSGSRRPRSRAAGASGTRSASGSAGTSCLKKLAVRKRRC